MLKYRYIIATCQGRYVQEIVFTIPVSADPAAYCQLALNRAVPDNYICDGCYDWAYICDEYERIV